VTHLVQEELEPVSDLDWVRNGDRALDGATHQSSHDANLPRARPSTRFREFTRRAHPLSTAFIVSASSKRPVASYTSDLEVPLLYEDVRREGNTHGHPSRRLCNGESARQLVAKAARCGQEPRRACSCRARRMALADDGGTHRMARHAHAVFLASGMHDQKVARKKAVVSVL
jgi:hypothetical protein